MVLKICETKNNVWKRYGVSIQQGIISLEKSINALIDMIIDSL